jgi:uncharacterized membrane protein YeaQ/YmgE (transglycosylase-associated protein family)
VGLVARFVLPGKQKLGLILTTVLGVVGSLLGGFIGERLGWYAAGEPAGFVVSVLGAIIVLVAWMAISKRT